MMLSRLLAALCLLFCSTALGQQTTIVRPQRQSPAKFQAVSSKEAVRKQEAAYEALVGKLVLTDQDTFEQRGQTYLRSASVTRICEAADTLSAAGKQSWAVVMRHLDDQRRSTATRETTGPHDVADKCYYILRWQVVSLPSGYPRSKVSPESELDEMFQPTLKQWLLARKDQSLEKMRVEVLEHLIALERAASNQDAKTTAESLARLEPHLALLKEQLRKASR
jgi:hypothetical protein